MLFRNQSGPGQNQCITRPSKHIKRGLWRRLKGETLTIQTTKKWALEASMAPSYGWFDAGHSSKKWIYMINFGSKWMVWGGPEPWLGGTHFHSKKVQKSSFLDLVFEKCRRGDLLTRSELFQSTQKKCPRWPTVFFTSKHATRSSKKKCLHFLGSIFP